jgi:hypothetical protein
VFCDSWQSLFEVFRLADIRGCGRNMFVARVSEAFVVNVSGTYDLTF